MASWASCNAVSTAPLAVDLAVQEVQERVELQRVALGQANRRHALFVKLDPPFADAHGARRVEPFPGLDARLQGRDPARAGGHVVLDGGAALAIGAQRFE